MSVKNFKFVSPGVFVNEIDNSFIPKSPSQIGPVVVGRTARGPAMRPVTISSFSDYIRVFGNPIPGGNGGDVWRDGNNVGPTYAAYAAQAYLASNVTPLTMMRLLGTAHMAYSFSHPVPQQLPQPERSLLFGICTVPASRFLAR